MRAEPPQKEQSIPFAPKCQVCGAVDRALRGAALLALVALVLVQLLQCVANGGDNKGGKGAVGAHQLGLDLLDQVVGKADGLVGRYRRFGYAKFLHKSPVHHEDDSIVMPDERAICIAFAMRKC